MNIFEILKKFTEKSNSRVAFYFRSTNVPIYWVIGTQLIDSLEHKNHQMSVKEPTKGKISPSCPIHGMRGSRKTS